MAGHMTHVHAHTKNSKIITYEEYGPQLLLTIFYLMYMRKTEHNFYLQVNKILFNRKESWQ